MPDRFDHTLRITMLLIPFTICCISACLANAFPANYRPYYHERTTYITDGRGYDDNNGGRRGNNEGSRGNNESSRSSNEGSSRQRQQSQSSQGSSDYGEGESHSIRDRIKKNKFDQGSKSSVSNSGGKQEQVKKSHDKGFYEKEKRYGYEKSYGYERETQSHDKASQSHSNNNNYDHKEQKAQHNIGEQFLRDLANDGKKYKQGSQSHRSKSDLFDTSSRHNIAKEFEAELTGDKFFKRSGPISNFAPNFVPGEYMFGTDSALKHLRGIHGLGAGPISNFAPNFIPREYMFGTDRALKRFKHLKGIHGLGGLRTNALNFGYNPLRYRYASPDMEAELLELNPLHLDVGKVFYSQV